MSRDHLPMQSYLIVYELNGEADLVADRRVFLTDRIRALFPSRCHPFEAGWFIRSDLPVAAIRDNLSLYLAAEDKLCVALLGGACAWHGLPPEGGTWLADHL